MCSMHTRSEVAEVLSLREDGLGVRRIANRTNLPLSTVRDWLAGYVPAHSRCDAKASRALPRCDFCGQDGHDFSGLPASYVYLLGLYLGDGSISCHPRSVYRLRITLDSAYPGIIQAASDATRTVTAGHVAVTPRRAQNCVDVSSGLIHSDGHRFLNTGRKNWAWPRYGFTQVSDDIRAIFCHTCDLMGLHWTRAGRHLIYISRKADVARLDEFIGPKR